MVASRHASNDVCLAVLLAMGAVTCAPAAEPEPRPVASIVAEFDRFLRDHNQCKVDADCVRLEAHCLHGCGVAVHKKYAKATARTIDELNDEYTATGDACTHWLCLPTTAKCVEQRCSIVAVLEFDGVPDAAVDGGESL